jgi:hypothetical protein
MLSYKHVGQTGKDIQQNRCLPEVKATRKFNTYIKENKFHHHYSELVDLILGHPKYSVHTL